MDPLEGPRAGWRRARGPRDVGGERDGPPRSRRAGWRGWKVPGPRREGRRRGHRLRVGRHGDTGDPVRRLSALLALLVGLPAAGQTAGVGAEPGPGGTIVGRVCVDLDRDDACQDGEPGISGARVRFEDGRTAIADDEGKFHAVEVAARTFLPERSAYGAHAVAVEGLGVRRSFELAPRGAVRVELPVTVELDEGGEGSVSSRGRSPPRLDGARILWPIAGTAPPGARIRSGAAETLAAPDGSWALSIPVGDGLNRVGVAIVTAEGGLSLWGFDLLLARPSSGPLRAYPGRPSLLAALVARPAGDGAVLVGRVASGVAL